MSDSHSIITAGASLADAASKIRASHDAALFHAEEAVFAALRAGLLLTQVRAALPHGSFQRWCKESLPEVSYRTALRYLKLAEGVALTPSQQAALLAGKSDSDLRSALVPQLGNRSLSQLYLDLGISAAPRKAVPPPAPRVVDPAAVRTQYLQVTREALEGLMHDIQEMAPAFEPEDIKQIEASLLHILSEVRGFLSAQPQPVSQI